MDIRVIFLAVVGFIGGIYAFFRGFWIYREYRLLSDTPETPIHSLPMGLVEIHGQAKGEQMLLSPVTCTPCHLFQVEVERSHRNLKGEKTTSSFFTDLHYVEFHLEDSSGKVLVDASKAELDLEKHGQRKFSGKLQFDPQAAMSHVGWVDPVQAARAVSRPSENELRAYVSRVASRQNIISATTHLGRFLGEFDEYSLEECCIVPGAWYDITGTCVENPKPADEHDLNMIAQGENEKTFLISSKTKKDIHKMLRRRAAAYIFGGAGLSIACLAVLLWMFS